MAIDIVKRRATAARWIREKRRRDPVFAAKESAKARRWQRANPVRWAWTNYRKNAELRGLPFTINRTEFDDLITDHCYYCGDAPDPTNGLDRVEPSSGYVEGNLVTACTRCNYAKREMTMVEFEAWILRVAGSYSQRRA